MDSQKILLAHGSGGRLTHDLIKNLLLKKLYNPLLNELSDSAVLHYHERIAFTTDSFVVNPLFFPGGDIGKLAVCGTINDLVMQGATPEYLSLAFIIEEGLDFRILERIIDSISLTAKKAGLYIVTGDLKVVERNACDKIFINTSGVGRIIAKSSLSINNIEPKDTVIVTGEIGQHGLAVLAKRGELELGLKVQSDCAALHDLLLPLLKKTGTVKFMRDPTRGGVATTLNEIAEARGLGIIIEEKKVPVSAKVRAACELLGIDPLYLPNEGRAIIVVKEDGAEKILRQLHIHPLGRKAQVIGTIAEEPKGCVVLNTGVGTQRIIDMLTNEPMPRIC